MPKSGKFRNLIVYTFMDEQGNNPSKFRKWLKRIGIWGFLFFLIKGLIWLLIFWWAARKTNTI